MKITPICQILFAFIASQVLAQTDRNGSNQSSTRDGQQFAIISVPHTGPVVSNTLDAGAGSLRQALLDAQAGDSITFAIPSSDTGCGGEVCTITLTSGQLTIDKNITIDGPGSANLIIRRNPNAAAFRIIQITLDHSVTIRGVTITNGDAGEDYGGGIYDDRSTLFLQNCKVTENTAVFGGAIANSCFNRVVTVSIDGCTLSANTAINGGAIYNTGSLGNAIMNINESTIMDNSTPNFGGGGIFNTGANGFAALKVTNSTLNGNSASNGYGGGIYNVGSKGYATLTIINSTLSVNSASDGYGGGIMSAGYSGHAEVTIINSTLSGNFAAFGGAICNNSFKGNASLKIGNSVLKTGQSGSNIFVQAGAVTTSLGYNLSDDDFGGFLTGAGDQINTDPILGPLKSNGGSTFTHAPLSGSPAIDVGKDLGPNGTPSGRDQRGSVRPITYSSAITVPPGGDRSDIGAVELSPGVLPVSAASVKLHAGTPYSIPLDLSGQTGVECRSGGVNNDYQVVVTFMQPVAFSSATVTSGAGSISSTTNNGNQVTLNLSQVMNAQTITLALFDVNDGMNSGDVGVRLSLLVGDTTGNGAVDNTDVSQTKWRSGRVLDADNFRSDVNASGAINATDVSAVKIKSGTSLP